MKAIGQSRYYFLLSVLFLLVGAVLIFSTDKGSFYLWINNNHRPFLDVFFKWFTHLGDGLFFLGVTLLLLFKRIQLSILFLTSYLVTGITAQFLKKLFFQHALRPSKYFEEIDHLHLVTGVDVHHYQSFPSGHAVTAFSLFFLLSIIFGNRLLSIVFFISALMVGISRIYLSQHFFEDVVGGAFIGIILTLLCYRFVSENSWFNQKAWMHLSLQQALKEKNEA